MQDKMWKFLIMVLSMVEVLFTMIWRRVQKRWWDLNGKLHFLLQLAERYTYLHNIQNTSPGGGVCY